MSGWDQGDSARGPSPETYWSRAETPDPLGPGRLIRDAWRLVRANSRSFLFVAAVPAVLQLALTAPSLALGLDVLRAMVPVMADYIERAAASPGRYSYADSQLFQAELEQQLRTVLVPDATHVAWTAIAGGVAMVLGLVGTAALTATALANASGRPIPTTFAFRLVAARAGLVKPILTLGFGYVVVSWLPALLQTSADFQAWTGAPGSPRSTLIASLLSVLALVVVVAIIVFAVRWALFIPAVLVEALGVGPGLARAAELSRGIRIRLALAMTGLIVLVAIVVGLASLVAGLAVGLSARSIELGFLAYVAIGLVTNALTAGLLPAIVAVAYRARTRADERTAAASAPG